jgi:uncharacterized membrane protein YeaQ/YmgE (transglycosylase-associated protein family)
MNLVALIIQLISGAVGGNVAGSVLKQYDLGALGNSVAGIVGGGIGGQLLTMLLGAAPQQRLAVILTSVPSSPRY